MASKSKAAKAGGTVMAARSSPYVQRLVSDPELRDNIKTAFDSARDALDRLGNGKTPTKVIFDDKKFHKEVQQASEALRDASVALREGDKKPRRKRRLGRKILMLLVGAGVALAVSEGLRNKVLDALFGKEEEFDYTSTTAAPAPPPPPAASSPPPPPPPPPATETPTAT
jgi:hypothetical protein